MCEENIKVSVIMPIYNMEKYLADSIESVLNQSIAGLEIICINDGSSDESLKIIERYKKNDKRIVVLDQINKGVAESRNRGIKEAKGKYVFFLDPDDYLPDPDTLLTLYNAAERNAVFIAGGQFSDFISKRKLNYNYGDTLYGYNFKSEGIIKYVNYQFDYGYQRFIYNRNFLIVNSIQFPPLVRFQDPPFMVQAFTVAEQFFALKKVTYCYRTGHQCIDWNEKKVLDLLSGIYMNMRWAKEHYQTKLLHLSIKRMEEYEEVIKKQFVASPQVRNLVWRIINDETLHVLAQMDFFSGYKQIKDSYSYKLGLMLTYFPRKAVKAVKKYRKHHQIAISGEEQL